LLDFVQKVTQEAAEYFTRSLLNEIELQKTMSHEHHKNLEQTIKELKQDFYREKEAYEQKIRNSELEKVQLSAMEQSIRENYDRL
jgi:hypothetical protein